MAKTKISFNPKNKNVYIKDWLFFHPYYKSNNTDDYFLKISREVFGIIDSNMSLEPSFSLPFTQKVRLACFLTCWFEDVISETGIWKTFIEEHSRLYGKFLPFYELHDYYPNDINRQDICFLIWNYFSNIYFENELIPPFSKWIFRTAEQIFNVFDREYELAPENVRLNEFLKLQDDEENFYLVKDKLRWLTFYCYLFHFTKDKFDTEIENFINEKQKDELYADNIDAFKYEISDNYIFNKVSQLLALKPNEWLAGILGNDHNLYHAVSRMSSKKTGSFLFLKEDDNYLYFKHLATDIVIPATKKSMERMLGFVEERTILVIGFIEWRGEWWFSGIFSDVGYSEELIQKEKESIESKLMFPEKTAAKQKELLNNQEKAFLEMNNKHIQFLSSRDNLQEFYQVFNDYYIRVLKQNMPAEKDELFEKEATKKPTLSIEGLKEHNQNNPVTVFFNPEAGVELYFGFTRLIPDEDNPFYQGENETDELLSLIHSQQVSPAFANYVFTNYGLEKTGMNGENNVFFMENLDFLMRFHKRNNYFTKPAVTVLNDQ
jgi:hypothetical protein